jgi:hypothetical protein
VRDGGRVKKERIRVGKIGEGLRVWKKGRVKGRKNLTLSPFSHS